ncbi:response regulator [Citricoccus sp. NPDC055426]|uniref:response regulator n=1 Tax=Citricoccus sp. NPDC055426 TaxID=3155536 RepID=UPI00341BBC97
MAPPTTLRHALVVEDDDDIRSLLVHTLNKEGFTVTEAPTGSLAVELVQSVQPELVTLDVQLPGVNGLEVCRQLREHSNAYVVMISARSTETDKLAGLEAGADDYLSKPFSTRELRARRGPVPPPPHHGLRPRAVRARAGRGGPAWPAPGRPAGPARL